ncbi:MAG: type II secretion system minor pseudopilin GspH [Gammaproteobacteria bacterium]|nr:type II secretion system minor pseudopilin GspH [Gammaproteobacteria bacterium]
MNRARAKAINRGFTLIELMVVLFIIGIIFSFAMLSVNTSSSKVIREEAQRLTSLIKLISEEAIFKSREYALQVSETGYEFSVLEPGDGKEKKDQWLTIGDDATFRKREFNDAVVFESRIEEEAFFNADSGDKARLYFLSSGEMSPFELVLRNEQSTAGYRITGQATGKLEMTELYTESAESR